MALKENEIGKIININAGFDLSGNTDLKMNFIKPDLATLTVDKAGGVSAPNVDFTFKDDNDVDVTFLANEYWSYPTASGDIDQTGTWKVSGEYIDGTPKVFCGDTSTFPVIPCT